MGGMNKLILTMAYGESLARWRRNVDNLWNIRREVTVGTALQLTDSSDGVCVEVQRAEVASALQKLNLDKAAGSDGISANLLKGGGSVVVDWFMELME